MTQDGRVGRRPAGSGTLGRRMALLAPLALGGCSLWDDWFGTHKTPLAGKREPVLAARSGLIVDDDAPKVVLPPAVPNAAWPQAGGNPAHFMGHLAAGERLAEAWSADIGSGGGYRRKIMAEPVAANGIVYVMDSDAVASAFDMASGSRIWRFDTRQKDDDSTNVGGGLAVDQGTLYAVNGLAEIVALDAAKGTVRWRNTIGSPARSEPTVVEGRVFVTTIEDKLLALAADDGRHLWDHQSATSTTSVLGRPAPAYAGGLVVGRVRRWRTGNAARRRRHRRVDRQSGGLGAQRQPGGFLCHPWPARDRRRQGLCHRPGWPHGRSGSANGTPIVGASGRR